jgi:CBS domain-containing protein
MPPRREGPVELPVRSVDILERNGRTVRLRVFCPSRYRSVDSSTCTVCPFVQTFSVIAVTCAPPGVSAEAGATRDKPLFLGPEALALRTPVGSVCALRSVAVRDDVSPAHARSVLDRYPFAVVLTPDDRVRGILSEAEPSDARSLGEIDGRTPILPEYAPLIEAIELMLRGHVRLVPVVDEKRRFLGLVADLDVLRWAARYQKDSRFTGQ